MMQTNTWQKLAVLRALRHETRDLDQDIFRAHGENRYGQ